MLIDIWEQQIDMYIQVKIEQLMNISQHAPMLLIYHHYLWYLWIQHLLYLNVHQLLHVINFRYALYLEKVILDDCGHFVPEEHPDIFNKIVGRFLDQPTNG